MDLEKLKKSIESGDAKEYFDKINEKRVLKEKRYNKFDAWLEENDFDKLMYRLLLEHNDDYIEKCYHNGFEPHPNQKLGFVISYIGDRCDPITVKDLDCPFSNVIYEFKGYYFQIIWGQGVATRIYNKDDMRLLLRV